VSLACRKAKELGYPHELWTTRLLARHVREHGPAEGHLCLVKLVQGTVCKILNEQEVKPHKVRYYLERRDPEFKAKMAEVLCIYREVKIIKETAAAAKQKPSDAVAIVSYDEKPGIQAIATTAPDLSPEPGLHATFARDHEYKRNGTVSLLAGIDLSMYRVIRSRVTSIRSGHRAGRPRRSRHVAAFASNHRPSGRQRRLPPRSWPNSSCRAARRWILCSRWMRNPALPLQLRFDAAVKAAPFVHPKLAPIEHGGKVDVGLGARLDKACNWTADPDGGHRGREARISSTLALQR
jgi:hypothetical protein